MAFKKFFIVLLLIILTWYSFYLIHHKYDAIPSKRNDIKIGVIIPLTGDQSRYGKYIKNGVQLAADELNNRNGASKIQLIFEDDQADPNKGISAINKLINVDHVHIVFGPWASSSALAVAPIAERSKVILMAEAISPQLKAAGEYIFRIQPDAKIYLDKLCDYINQERQGIKKIGILYINNDFGQDQAKYFKIKMEGIERSIVLDEAYSPNTSNFKEDILKIKKQKIDAVFCPAYAELSTILIQMKQNNLNVQIFGSVPTENQDIVESAKGAAEGVIYPHHFNPDSDNLRFKEFVASYERKYNQKPEGFASLAYDGIYLISKAIDISKGDNPDQIKNALHNIKNFQGVNGIINFDKDGDVIIPIVIKQIRNNTFNVIWK